MIKIFIPKFLNILPQPPRDNPWPKNPTNKNFKTWFHRQCYYFLGFQASRKIRDSILKKRWPRNDTDEEDDPHKTSALAYNREMDQLVVANTVNNEME